MDVRCPACSARYTADDDKLRGKTARMRCRACETVWMVSGPDTSEKPAESKRAAIVKRGAEREHRDLFASRPADLGSVKQTLRPPPPDSLVAGMAARNETSVLFTVDALKGAARVKTPQPEPTPMSSGFRSDDDDGIIDLKALASSPPKGRVVAPLFSEPPPAAFAADVSDLGRASSPNVGFRLGKRAIAGMAAAAVAVVLCSIGLAAAFRGEEPVARAANAAMAPIPPPVVAAPAPAPAPAPVVASVSTNDNSNDDDAKAPAKKGKAGKGKGGKATFVGTKVQSSGVSSKKSDPLVSKAPATPKAADKCGCKGDFNCILRCTATGK